MTYMSINLGNIDLKAAEVTECGDCHSRNLVKVKGEPDKEAISAFVRNRAGRIGLNIADYDIKIDGNGLVTAVPKASADLEIEFT